MTTPISKISFADLQIPQGDDATQVAELAAALGQRVNVREPAFALALDALKIVDQVATAHQVNRIVATKAVLTLVGFGLGMAGIDQSVGQCVESGQAQGAAYRKQDQGPRAAASRLKA
jgi:hypothetical protein